jgi:hypothetical protein
MCLKYQLNPNWLKRVLTAPMTSNAGPPVWQVNPRLPWDRGLGGLLVYSKPCGTEDDIYWTILKCHPILLYEGVRYTLSCPDNSSYEWLQVKIDEPWLFGWVQIKPFVNGSGITESPLVPVHDRCSAPGTIGFSCCKEFRRPDWLRAPSRLGFSGHVIFAAHNYRA